MLPVLALTLTLVAVVAVRVRTVHLIIGAADGGDRRLRRDAHAGATGAAAAGRGVAAAGGVPAPRLLQDKRVRARAVIRSNRRPEGGPVSAVDGIETAHVDRVAGAKAGRSGQARRGGRWEGRAVEAERARTGTVVVRPAVVARDAGRRAGLSAVPGRGHRGHGVGVGVVERSGIATGGRRGGSACRTGPVDRRQRKGHGSGLGEDGREARGGVGGSGGRHDAGEFDADRAGGAVGTGRHGRGDGPAGAAVLVDRRGNRGLEDGRVPAVGGTRRHGGGALAAVAAVAELVVVKTACKLRLLQVGGDVLVGHLLHACLEEISFLYAGLVSQWTSSPIPSPSRARTSSSLHARPPPVEAVFLFFEMP